MRFFLPIVVLAAVVGCRGARAPAAATVATTSTWDYVVHDQGDELAIEATFGPTEGDAFAVDDDATPFVRAVEVADGAAWRAVADRGGRFGLACGNGCRLRYRFRLRAAALALDDAAAALAVGKVLVAPPSTWLLRPTDGEEHAQVRLTAPDAPLVCALHVAADGARELAAVDVDGAGLVVFGRPRVETLPSGDARIEVVLAAEELALDDAAVLALLRADVDALAHYFGRFPVDRLLLVVGDNRGSGPSNGLTLGGGGASVLVQLARDVDLPHALVGEWVPIHELLHAAMPDLPRQHGWLSEGLASYLEPLVRERAGLITPEKLWRELVEGAPQGLPAPGDQGLDGTHTWARTYWGGTLFCLLADVRIREQTAGRASLDDAMRAIAAAGGTVVAHWSLDRWIDAGDAATGTHVLRELYVQWAHAPVPVDLGALWKQLGVVVTPDAVRFDDAAPLAAIRRAMTPPIR